MGLFGSSKTVVSSSVQNLAGDELERPDYLKTTIVGNIISGTKESVADTIQRSYVEGPGLKLRNFFTWAGDNYDEIGLPSERIGHNSAITGDVVAGEIPSDPGITIRVSDIIIGAPDYHQWAVQWMLENHPTLASTLWKADYNETTNQILITFADETTDTFTPTSFDKDGTFLYAFYHDTSETVVDESTVVNWDGPYLYIYQAGTGNTTLDPLIVVGAATGEYFPYIPIRLENEFLSETNEPDAYNQAKAAFKKSIDGDLDEVITEIGNLSSLSDIDFAYAVFGVSANVLENKSKKYIYKYLEKLMASQSTSLTDYTDWKTGNASFNTDNEEWQQWRVGQEDELSDEYGEPQPTPSEYEAIPKSNVRIKANGNINTNFDMEISWNSMFKITGTGLGKTGAEPGDYWFGVTGSAETFSGTVYNSAGAIAKDDIVVDTTRLYYQIDNSNWEAIEIIGMVHKNFVYNGKYVEITLKDAIEDSDESGFIFPIHQPTYRAMSLVDTTQMSTACCFIVFNSYEIHKTGIFGSFIFKIFIISLFVAAVVFAPGFAPGLAKAGLATGTAIGLTGTLALIVGVTVNAITAMIIGSLLTKGAIAIFGDKLGLVLGIIASVVSMNVMTNLTSGAGAVVNFGNMMSASNIMLLTNSVGNIYAQFTNLDTMGIINKTNDLTEEYKKEAKKISEQFIETFGLGGGIIDPLNLLDNGSILVEYSDAFLARTLMTGTDIADMSLEMISSFAELTLSNKLPLSNT